MATVWLVRKTGSDSNGGTSKTVRSTGTGGVTTAINTTLTDVGAAWTSADIGHGINIGGNWRTVTAVASTTSLTYSGGALGVLTGQTWTIGGSFLTIGKAVVGSTPLAGDDSVYVGAGVYRENVTLGVSGSSGHAISLIGDVDGAQTGDAGEVRVTNCLVSERVAASGAPLVSGGKTDWTISKLVVVGGVGSATGAVQFTNGSVRMTIQDCAVFMLSFNAGLGLAAVGGASSSYTVDRCLVWSMQNAVNVTTIKSGSTDYSNGVTIRNSLLIGVSGSAINHTIALSASGLPGGTAVVNCTLQSGTTGVATAVGMSTSIPVTAQNCLVHAGTTAFSAGTSGQLTEDWNLVTASTLYGNVAAGAHTVGNVFSPVPHLGQEWVYGGPQRQPYTPMASSPAIGFGGTSVPTVDLPNRQRPDGTTRLIDSGTATSGAATTLTDTGKTWGANALAACTVKIVSGTGSGQVKTVNANTATVLTVDGNWTTNPDSTSVYRVVDYRATTGKATAGAATTLTDSGAAWGVNEWTGATLEITGGTGTGQTKTVVSNTATVLTVGTWTTNPDSTSTYSIYRLTSVDTPNPAAGALERHDTAERESVTVDASTYSGRLTGKGTQEFQIPVDAVSTTITVRMRFDTEATTFTKPTVALLAEASIGVSASTVTVSAVADTWQTITLGPFTPSAPGVVTVRITARSVIADGCVFFDTVTVS